MTTEKTENAEIAEKQQVKEHKIKEVRETVETHAERKPETERKSRAADDVVFVGKKPTMAYVMAVITQFSEGMKQVHLKARGKSISRAVDVAEVVRSRFLNDLKHTIEIGTEKLQGEQGRELNVSTIKITLSK